jgi:hypothetical protein
MVKLWGEGMWRRAIVWERGLEVHGRDPERQEALVTTREQLRVEVATNDDMRRGPVSGRSSFYPTGKDL